MHIDKSTLRELSETKIGGHVKFEDKRLTVRKCFESVLPCTQCFFNMYSKKQCKIRDTCMGHKRKDRESVYFKNTYQKTEK